MQIMQDYAYTRRSEMVVRGVVAGGRWWAFVSMRRRDRLFCRGFMCCRMSGRFASNNYTARLFHSSAGIGVDGVGVAAELSGDLLTYAMNVGDRGVFVFRFHRLHRAFPRAYRRLGPDSLILAVNLGLWGKCERLRCAYSSMLASNRFRETPRQQCETHQPAPWSAESPGQRFLSPTEE
jgi:hypothetical protein